ncbi:MAG: proteobacterial dedicated sortase system histidine kinase [Halioglobus sp.]|nr:proteobacterial dedicated sortase system histidine kinase [Halioglobus sp.]
MNLRRQLLVVSLLLLSLPWAGCQFIREMEGAMRNGQEQSLRATAQAIATVLGTQQELLYPIAERRHAAADERESLYAYPTSRPVYLDGYADGWETVRSSPCNLNASATLSVTCQAQADDEYLYLMLKVTDPEVVYHNPRLSREPNGDRLILRLWQNGRRQDYVIATTAPGHVRASAASRRERDIEPGDIQGYWQDAIGGYTIELQIPLAYTGGRLGLYVADTGRERARTTRQTVGNISPLDSTAPPWLISSPPRLQALLAPFRRQGSRIQVVDRNGWQIAEVASNTPQQQRAGETFWLLQLLYRSILSQDTLASLHDTPRAGKLEDAEIRSALSGDLASQRYNDPDNTGSTIQSVAAPIIDNHGVLGAVIVRQSGETYLSLTDRAFSRLLAYSLSAMAIAALGLLGYASVLSWRIRKLSHAANNAIAADGQVSNSFPRSKARDEIGDLSRHYARLLDRVREYNDYLRTLSRKLSHELRTPIAVIQSSLDNLEHSGADAAQSDTYLQRAREGLSRLQRILKAMSEANRLEESIQNNPLVELDLVPLLTDVCEAYREVYPQHRLALEVQVASAPVAGVADLIIQALDKLMDNAASFCSEHGNITVHLREEPGYWNLSVANEGPALPAGIKDRLFEPMVSLREQQTGSVHLGLGLHIVRLIVDFHHGRVSVDNLADDSGVVISMRLPRQ